MSANVQHQNFVKKRRDNTLMQMAYNELRESIISNSIQPGDVLSEQQIAQQLNISRTPVREALAILESEGLIEIRRGIGAFVKPLSYKDISNIFEVRRPLEALAVKSAIYHITSEDIQDMRDRFNDLLARYERNERVEVREFSELDFAFHDLIIERCENPYVRRFMHTINSNVRRLQVMFRTIHDPKDAIRQHLQLLQLIENRDLEALEAELDNQLDVAMRSFINV